MNLKRRRNIEVFSLSFLDCVCCGFGALILLLVLSKTAEPIIFEEYSKDLEQTVTRLRQELSDLHGQINLLNRQLVSNKAQLARRVENIARLQAELATLQGQYAAARDDATVQNIIEAQLAAAKQQLTAAMRRLRAASVHQQPDTTVGGIPVDSEYIIFIIDTSGSMQNYGWHLVQQKLAEVLNVYPKVKGIQIMNDMGEYMFQQYTGKWIPDTPARRKAVLKRLRTWRPFSNSSPVEGISAAIRTFYAADKDISLYVFGDEFTGPSIDTVLHHVDRINKRDQRGNRRVRIHAVGFPIQFGRPQAEQTTGIRFATLMRALCERNGGTFIGLNSYTP